MHASRPDRLPGVPGAARGGLNAEPHARGAVEAVAWYHTIRLPDGATPGWYDMPAAARHVPLPDSLAGMRCLDVGTSDGFWAFELERRGAREVVGIDLENEALDWSASVPPEERGGAPGRSRRAFEIAARALESRVERRELSVYDLTPERVGTFDLVFTGALLLHLRDPVGALEAVRAVTAGELLLAESISVSLTLLRPGRPAATLSRAGEPRWWTPNVAALREMVERAGFEVLAVGRPFRLPFGKGFPRPPWRDRVRSPRRAAFWAVTYRLGAPLTWLRARPAQPAAGSRAGDSPASTAAAPSPARDERPDHPAGSSPGGPK